MTLLLQASNRRRGKSQPADPPSGITLPTANKLSGFGPTNTGAAGFTPDMRGAAEGNIGMVVFCSRGTAADRPDTPYPSGWSEVANPVGGTSGSDPYLTAWTRTNGSDEGFYDFLTDGTSYKTWAALDLGNVTGSFVENLSYDTDGSNTVSFSDTDLAEPAMGIMLIGSSGGNGETDKFVGPDGWEDVSNAFGLQRSGLGIFRKDFAAGQTGAITATQTQESRAKLLFFELAAVSTNAIVGENGFDVLVATDTPGSVSIKAGTASSETSRTVESTLQLSTNLYRLRLANGDRIYSTDSVLVSDSSQGITDESPLINQSAQTATTVTYLGVTWTFASAPTVGITAAGEPSVTNAVNVTAASYTQLTGEEQYTIHGSVVDPAAGTGAEHAFHPEADFYNVSTAASYPLTLAADECLMTAVGFPAADTRANSTAYSVGDVIEESGRVFRCTTAGTTAGSKPSWSSGDEQVTDGTVVWTRGARIGDNGRSWLRKVSVLHCAGATLKSQDTFRCGYTSGGTKRYFTTSDVNLGLLPSSDTGYADVSTATKAANKPWWDIGFINGGAESESIPEEWQPGYGQDIQVTSSTIAMTLLGQASNKTELAYFAVQRGIDRLCQREGGGYWRGFEGWTQGRSLLPILAIALLEEEATLMSVLATSPELDEDWQGFELGEQMGYVDQGVLDTEWGDGYDYSAGQGGTFVDPDNAPSTYSDSPANAYFPASVRGEWIHVPEFGMRWKQDTTIDSPRWSAKTSNNYRRCCTATSWSPMLEVCRQLNLFDYVPAYFEDYMHRYYLVEQNDNFDFKAIYEDLYFANRDTHTFTATATDSSTVELTFRYYTTATNATWLAQLSCSGGVTLSSPNQTGPRVWEFTTSANSDGETITLTTDSGLTDAGGNDVPTQAVVVGA